MQISHSSIFPVEIFSFASRLLYYLFSFIAIKILHHPLLLLLLTALPLGNRCICSHTYVLQRCLFMLTLLPEVRRFYHELLHIILLVWERVTWFFFSMRTISTEIFMVDNAISAANSGKSFVGKLDTLGQGVILLRS